MTKRSRPHLVVGVICVLALAGFGAACGSSSSSNTTNTTTGTSGGGGTSTGTGPISTSSGGGLSDSQFCSLAKKWSTNQSKEITALTSASNGNLKTFYTTLAKEYQQVLQAAPSEIKPDLNTLIGVFNKFYVVLQNNNFNIQKAEGQLAGLASSFNSAKVKAAVAHLDQWAHANNCVIKTTG